MTRTTNFRRKRTYLEAGFESVQHDAAPPTEADDALSNPKPSSKDAYKEKRSEQRRLKRIAERASKTVCFMCREPGHTAKSCPKAPIASNININIDTNGDVNDNAGTSERGKTVCYRCGSMAHTLSRCRKPEDPHNPLPYASCFVCFARGHLAAACPRNAARKGNHRSCQLCDSQTHPAQDCPLRRHDQAGTAALAVFGKGAGGGADEDDFHVFKRRAAEVEKVAGNRPARTTKKVVYF